jgi:hypothetical protein
MTVSLTVKNQNKGAWGHRNLPPKSGQGQGFRKKNILSISTLYAKTFGFIQFPFRSIIEWKEN